MATSPTTRKTAALVMTQQTSAKMRTVSTQTRHLTLQWMMTTMMMMTMTNLLMPQYMGFKTEITLLLMAKPFLCPHLHRPVILQGKTAIQTQGQPQAVDHYLLQPLSQQQRQHWLQQLLLDSYPLISSWLQELRANSRCLCKLGLHSNYKLEKFQ